MLTVFRDVNDARSGRGRGLVRCQNHEAKANSHEAEAEAEIALMFFSQIVHFDPHLISQKKRNFRSILAGTSKISAQNGL